MKIQKRFFYKFNRLVVVLLVATLGLLDVPGLVMGNEGNNGDTESLLIHMVTDANKNDANACIAFNLAWVAVEQGLKVEMLFDSWAAYNIKQGDFWAKYRVPERYRKMIVDAVGHQVDWKGGTYMDLLQYLQGKGMAVTVNKTFLTLSGDDKKIPAFIKQLALPEMANHIRDHARQVTY